MIDGYASKEMKKIWNEEAKFQAFLDVEIAVLHAWNSLGVIPSEDVEEVEKKASFSVDRIKEIEEVTKHDVIAFTRCVSESLGEEKKWVHYGLTSTDVVDTANALQIKRANEILDKDIVELLDSLKIMAYRYKNTPCIGRTHGIHADITAFGLKWALFYDVLNRNYRRFKEARRDIECGKISGAVGNYANIPPQIEDFVMRYLDLGRPNISTQVLMRDNHANYFNTLALISESLEQMAFEIRSLSRTEIHEVEEGFSKGQKGSSAMPHKKNPIASENICGCARVMRGYMLTSNENISLWHERDISHSSTERIILPDATELLDYMLRRMKAIVDHLEVFTDNMLKNIYVTHGVIFSQRVMNKIIEKGNSRESSYDLIQEIALKAYNNSLDFKELLLNDERVIKYLNKEDIESCFSLDYYFKNVDYIFSNVFK